jgi:hypothetical protein
MSADQWAIREHWRVLYGYDNGGDVPGMFVSVWAKRGKEKSICCSVPGDALYGDAITYVAMLADHGCDVYFSVCLLKHDPGPHERGKAEDAAVMPAFFMDVDVGKPKTPANLAEALDFIASLPLEPTLVIGSGGGLHVYWGFKELEFLESADDRKLADRNLKAFQTKIIEHGMDAGWKFDGTADLARILRFAGTFNFKSEAPRPVCILHLSDARYSPVDLKVMCAKPVPSNKTASKDVQRPRSNGNGGADIETRIRAYLAEVGGWQPGNRDNACWGMTRFMRNKLELPATDALEWLRVLNNECGDPLDDGVLTEKIRRWWAA